MSIKILLADDHEIVREGLRMVLDKQADLEVVAEAGDGHKAVQLAQKFLPDIVIMDITMPRMNGMEATRRIVSKHPSIKIIALSQRREKQFVQNMVDAGASGYVHKACGHEELLKAIRAVLAHQRYFCPLVSSVQPKYPKTPQRGQKAIELTAREREVLQLLAEGKTTREIAAILGVSVKTIETHRQQIMIKLNTRSIADLTKFAIRQGITSLEQ